MDEKICDYCGNYYMPTGRYQRYCPYCKYLVTRLKARFRDRKSRGFLHGAQPKGSCSPSYISGIGIYMKKAQMPSAACEICGSTQNLCVHHLDHDRYNNADNNLQVLCKKCHQKVHHAVTYFACDAGGNVLHTLVSRDAVRSLLKDLGYFTKSLSGLRRAIRNGNKLYGFYWKRAL